ncbi:inhibitory synaptic factor 2A-like [Elgaria multicarinata webbii]|uniref:inhibitory synaptic factor 2A-like n=1 Tax=Elgaria multicarinata webbii TaxID=159646 RepID=UPI002FCD424E
MVSKETGPVPSQGAEGSQEKAMTVRSALLKRDSPDAQGHLQRRRRHRTQQVRFKDPVESHPSQEGPCNNTPCASTAPEWVPPCARHSWPQAKPHLLPLPTAPHKACLSTAIQTSPSLRRPSRVTPFAWEEALGRGVGHSQDPPPWGSTSLPAHSPPPASPCAQQGPKASVALAPHLPPPPPRCPGPPWPGHRQCLQHKPCCASCQPPASPPGALWPCSPSLTPDPTEQASSEPPSPPRRQLPRAPRPVAQGSFRAAPTPAFLLWYPARLLPPTAPTTGEPATSVASQGTLLSTAPARPAAAEKDRQRCPQGPPACLLLPRPPHCSRSPEACLTPRQAETLRHVQDLLQLVAGAPRPPGPSGAEEPLPASQDPAGEAGHLPSQLQALEGVLETSQQTIKVLLDVIQDLEKKEAQRDGRQSYRTGQDTANCGTCRDCACIIYSVEHDFRRQEGRFQPVLSTIGLELSQSPTTTTVLRGATRSRQEPPPTPGLPAKAEPQRSWRRCFWFL